jgi:FlaA1/EpsC-like NDP-sugar epimerase
VMEWLIFTVFAVGTRLGYLVLQHLFGTLPTPVAPPVYILGADDETLALLNQLRDPLSPRRARILGILDDDPEKRGRSVNGVPVLGPIRALPGLLHRNGDAICLLGVSAYSNAGKRILRFCRQAGIDAYPDLNAMLHSSDGEPARIATPPGRRAAARARQT